MAIPLEQLEIWSHKGAVATSRDTYQSIRSVLCASRVPYADKHYEVYLQGSYGNDTNIFSESDVDVVIQLNSTFNSNKHELPHEQLALHERDYGPATYTASDFRKDVISVLGNHYGIYNVTDGKKSVKLSGVSSRRNADIVVCTQYRKYAYYAGSTCPFVEGMMINNQGESTINYPRLHAGALTQKHQQTLNRFKPLVRVLKNIKTRMVACGYINEKTAASYYIEGWLYNAPNDLFAYDLRERFEKVCNWLLRHDDITQFMMPHGQFPLIGIQNNQWASNDLEAFSEGLIEFDRRY